MKNKKLLGIAALAAVTAVGGSFAYFTQTMEVENPFNTATYGSVTVENFDPTDGEGWKPGAEVNKDLIVYNTGDQPIVVRVKFEDIWSRGGSQFKPTAAEIEAKTYDSTHNYGQAEHVANVLPKDDGEVTNDGSVVHKQLLGTEGADAKWVYNANDGYYYYKTPLAKKGAEGSDTGLFLDYVWLDKEADMGKFDVKRYWTATEGTEIPDFADPEVDLTGWNLLADGAALPKESKRNLSTTVMDPGKKGYSGANYTLKITVETVQATDKAVADQFKTAPEDVVTGWNLASENTQSGSTQGN